MIDPKLVGYIPTEAEWTVLTSVGITSSCSMCALGSGRANPTCLANAEEHKHCTHESGVSLRFFFKRLP